MVRNGYLLFALILILSPLFSVLSLEQTSAAPPANDPFSITWARSDLPVSTGEVDRTWMWGPAANTRLLREPYRDSPGGVREVQYFEKSRMEINDPSGDPTDIWYVTNGLLASDLMNGRVQVGDDEFVPVEPARIPVAGDLDDQAGPTYAAMAAVQGIEARNTGDVITEELSRSGEISVNPDRARFDVRDGYYVPETGHNVASVFWEFMNASGTISIDGAFVEGALFSDPFFATGFPLTEAYWSTVSVAGEARDVLVQVFERRVLTYTPDNPDGWRVEAGNVGLHYYHWVYDTLGIHEIDEVDPPATPVPDDEAVCLNTIEQEFLVLINDYRKANGLDPLSNSAALNVSSHNHSKDMGERAYFDHVNPDGLNPSDRMAAEGYTFNTYRAENIAAGFPTAQAVFDAWRDSPGHNANMLSPNLNVIGIARVETPGSPYGVYWTTNFGGHVDAAPGCSGR